jgi:hypothetical protein
MLNTNDLYQIRNVIKEEVQSSASSVKSFVKEEINAEITPIKTDIKMVKKDIKTVKLALSRVQKDAKVMIAYFDRDYVSLRKRIELLEKHCIDVSTQ